MRAANCIGKCGYAMATRWRQVQTKRPTKTWRQTFQKDLQEMRVSWRGGHRVASVPNRRKNLVVAATPAGMGKSNAAFYVETILSPLAYVFASVQGLVLNAAV